MRAGLPETIDAEVDPHRVEIDRDADDGVDSKAAGTKAQVAVHENTARGLEADARTSRIAQHGVQRPTCGCDADHDERDRWTRAFVQFPVAASCHRHVRSHATGRAERED